MIVIFGYIYIWVGISQERLDIDWPVSGLRKNLQARA